MKDQGKLRENWQTSNGETLVAKKYAQDALKGKRKCLRVGGRWTQKGWVCLLLNNRRSTDLPRKEGTEYNMDELPSKSLHKACGRIVFFPRMPTNILR